VQFGLNRKPWAASWTLQASLYSQGQIRRVTVSDTPSMTTMVSTPRRGRRKRSRRGKRPGADTDKSAAGPSSFSITCSGGKVVRKNDPCTKRPTLRDLHYARTATAMLAKERLRGASAHLVPCPCGSRHTRESARFIRSRGCYSAQKRLFCGAWDLANFSLA